MCVAPSLNNGCQPPLLAHARGISEIEASSHKCQKAIMWIKAVPVAASITQNPGQEYILTLAELVLRQQVLQQC